MGTAYVRQRGFSGGELSPLLRDPSFPLYAKGAAYLANWLVTRQGALVNRPGTTLVARTKADAKVKLVPFVFNEGQSYVLELGEGYVRVHKNGGTVLDVGGAPYETASPFQVADFPRLRSAQQNDVRTFTHQRLPPQELKRLGDANWSLGPAPFDNPHTGYILGFDGAINQGPAAAGGDGYLREWQWCCTKLDANGRESLIATVLEAPNIDWHLFGTPGKWVECSPGRPVKLVFPGGLTESPPKHYTIYVYRGEKGKFGRVAEYHGTLEDFLVTDYGATPDYTKTPPTQAAPFLGPGSYPALVARIGDQRTYYANTGFQPTTVWGSKVGDDHCWDKHDFILETDPFEFMLAQLTWEEIRALVPLKDLIVFTSAAAWEVSGAGQGESMSPISIRARPHSYHGCGWLEPLLTGSSVLFVSESGRIVRDLVYDYSSESWGGDELSALAHHLFEGRTVVA